MATIFTFSTTGNCLYVAQTIAKSINASVVSMNKTVKDCDDSIIGFVFPVYFMGLPKTVETFVNNLSITNPNSYIFAVLTAGSSFIGGVEGAFSEILKNKNQHLSYSTKLQCVGNYLPLYQLHDTKEVHEKVEKNLSLIIKDIELQKTNKAPRYSFIAKLVYSKYPALKDGSCAEKFTVNNCNGCGICESVCPLSNIHLAENKAVFGKNCQLCLACLHICPQSAIDWNRKTEGKSRYKNPNIPKQDLIEFLKIR